ncbi:MAG: tRNA (5-methylaminomethyl-2-thiouridine)(34)-methyltransferase MnmD, partial [Bacteroidetes bacterium]|nr:tRNA (5-methylaminomethyl-2-thiouridine)(34)-methyltransferase MnmD [Bacteroidota bacterium]
RILEIGFGTGLNAFLTHIETEKNGINVHYTAVEAFPLEENCWQSLNYPGLIDSFNSAQIFRKIHQANWEAPEIISTHFTLQKIYKKLEEYFPAEGSLDLIYFDAFGPDAQPELWTEQIFRNLSKGLSPGGMLVTYSVKGAVVRALRSCGFSTEKLPGPTGKRHILRAIRR